MNKAELKYLETYGVHVEKLFREDQPSQPQGKPVTVKSDSYHPRLSRAEKEMGDAPGIQRHIRSYATIEKTIRDYEG